MKKKYKKLLTSGIAMIVAGMIAAEGLLQTSVSVQASAAMMPGIEQIVEELSESEPLSKPFQILEIVDKYEDAELGYYVSGQEPYLKRYQYKGKDGQDYEIAFSSVEDALSKIPDEKLRKEFMMNVKFDENGNTQPSTLTRQIWESSSQEGKDPANNPENYPVSFSEDYEEKYFLSDEEENGGWTRVDFKNPDGSPRKDKVKIRGSYEPNYELNGNYTKLKDKYYPIRADVDEGNTYKKFRENIEGFTYNDDEGSNAPYHLEFEPVENISVNASFSISSDDTGNENYVLQEYQDGRYGYYENIYADLNQEIVSNIQNVENNVENAKLMFPGENPSVVNDKLIAGFDPRYLPKAFMAGDEELFSSVVENPAQAEQPTEEPVVLDPEEEILPAELPVISDGEFSSGTLEEAFLPDDLFSSESNFSAGNAAPDSVNPLENVEPDTIQPEGNAEVDNLQPEVNNETAVTLEEASTANETVAPEIGFGFNSDNNDPEPGTSLNPYIYRVEIIDEFPFYKYILVSDLKGVVKAAQESENRDAWYHAVNGDSTVRGRTENEITCENGSYYIWLDDGKGQGTTEKKELSIVTGRMPVAYSDVCPLSDKIRYDYYYRVSKVYFCCEDTTETGKNPADAPEAYRYFGWYHPIIKSDEEEYIPVDGNTVPTHYMLDSIYELTPEKGDYDFKISDEQPELNVEVDHMYYKGGAKNNDWLKRYVFFGLYGSNDLNTLDEKVRKQFEKFQIEVDTMRPSDCASLIVSQGKALEAGFSSPGEPEEAAYFYDSSDQESVFTDSFEETSSENGADVFGTGETSEVSVPVSYSQEIVGIETEEVFYAGEGLSADENTEPFIDIGSGIEEGSTILTPKLNDYDLVYVNGTIGEELLKNITELGIPCIINQKYYLQNNGMESVFKDYEVTTDADGHYVNKNMYFFKTGDEKLVNLSFHKNFSEPNIEDGFKEIKDYIEEENKYRNVEQSEFDDGNKKLLSGNISQARAIEYIINYKYKRIVTAKNKYRVLEIQPAKSGGKVQEIKGNDVFWWLGYPIESVMACTYHNNAHAPTNIFDNNDRTIWHTSWNNNYDKCKDSSHSLTIKLKNPAPLAGLVYTPRPSGNDGGAKNGIFINFNLILKNSGGDVLFNQSYDWSQNVDNNKRNISFDGKTFQNVKTIEFSNIKGYNGHASCAELDLIPPMDIEITSMTSSEFVGNIQDLNTEYDMIYWGAKGRSDQQAKFINGADDAMLYTHVGDYASKDEIRLYDSDDERNRMLGIMNKDMDGFTETIAQFRGSGNDITQQQVDAVLEFAKSGYPVIISDNLYSGDQIDQNKTDNSSYVYELLTRLNGLKGKYHNICKKSEADTGDKNFFANLPKPVIRFFENGKPANAIKENGNTPEYIGNELRYVFQIEDEAQTSIVNARYNCELFLDLNSDGNFSSKERLDDIQIQDKDGKTLLKNAAGQYELSMNQKYVLTRPVPEPYIKLITWKLKVSNNSRPQIWTTERGYCRKKIDQQTENPNQNGDQDQIVNPDQNKAKTIKVLQIMTNKNARGYRVNRWVLDTHKPNPPDNKFNSLLNDLKKQNFEFEIDVSSYYIEDYVDAYKEWFNIHKADILDDRSNLLKEYDMLIIGFADMVGNIPDEKPEDVPGFTVGSLTAILNFIKDGKSVLFAHDTTAFYNNWPDENDRTGPNQWGRGFNTILRPVLGLDRYGVTNKDIKDILKEGKDLEKGTPAWNTVYNNRNHFKDEVLLRSNGDMAYQTGCNREKTYWQTHGFNNVTITYKNGSGAVAAYNVERINEGAITKYPYVIPDKFKVSKTHGQYYQLALEEDSDRDGTNDIIVWYCLSGGYYDWSPKDVRNNYYLYSKGNVMYTGVGHEAVTQEDEIKLFINTIVAAYRSSVVDPKVQFVSGFSRTAKKVQEDYYMTDQYIGYSDVNVIDNKKEIYFTVDDYNLVSSDKFTDDSKSMKLELFIDDENGNKISPSGTLYVKGDERPISRKVVLDENRKPYKYYYTVNSGNVYKFVLDDLEQYVTKKGTDGNKTGYRNDAKFFANVSIEFEAYGRTVKGSGNARLDLKQRQLFDLD